MPSDSVVTNIHDSGVIEAAARGLAGSLGELNRRHRSPIGFDDHIPEHEPSALRGSDATNDG
jgi:hypothetical protein